ncbi:MAG TPA: hypothetical protein VJT32_09360 [bacterium]|nr:hypothetical protein [bacterium]
MSEAVIERNGYSIEPRSQWVPSGRGVKKGWRPKAVVMEAGPPRFEYLISPQGVETFSTQEEANSYMLRWAREWVERRRLPEVVRHG